LRSATTEQAAPKLTVATGGKWPGAGIGDRQPSARPPRTTGFRRDDRNRGPAADP